jgi:hypothetical protein
MNLCHGTVSCTGANTGVCTSAKTSHILKPSGRWSPADGTSPPAPSAVVGRRPFVDTVLTWCRRCLPRPRQRP